MYVCMYIYSSAYNLMITIIPKEMDSALLGFEPGSILAFQDLRTTDVATSRLHKKLRHLVEVNQRDYIIQHVLQWKNGLFLVLLTTACLDGFGLMRGLGCVHGEHCRIHERPGALAK